ncbi:MAG: energy transducer TonB [Acidobacteriaceae bacterium]|nr:energy transducer TonB [Acidobacteriaceae bacterium]
MYLRASRRVFLRSLTLATSFTQIVVAVPQSDTAQEDDRVYEPGGDVKPPRLLHYVEPEFSPSSKEAYVEGTVKLSTLVTTAGKPIECRIIRGLSAEEDRTAMEALKQWTFEPGTKNGRKVKVRITVEIDFHLL